MRNLRFGSERTTLKKMKTMSTQEQLGEYAEKFRIKKQGVKRWEWYVASLLFAAGISWNIVSPIAYIHELGHVLFGFFTGGGGYIVHSHLPHVSGWDFMVDIGGSLFVILFGHLLFAFSLKLRRPWIGSFWLGCAFSEIFWFPGSQDALNAQIEAWQWYGIAAVVLFFLWVFILYVGVRNLRTRR
jgi:hypothetical protein